MIESLMALAILGVIVGVLVRVHLQTLRAEEFSRLQSRAILESETILTGSLLGSDPKSTVEEARKRGWMVEAARMGDPGMPAFMEWRVAVSNPGAPVVVMRLREPVPEAPSVSRKGPLK